jgi:hypothetical protein
MAKGKSSFISTVQNENVEHVHSLSAVYYMPLEPDHYLLVSLVFIVVRIFFEPAHKPAYEPAFQSVHQPDHQPAHQPAKKPAH